MSWVQGLMVAAAVLPFGAALAAKALAPRSEPEVSVSHLHVPLVSVREQAAIIGTVSDELPGKVILRTPWNTKRYLDLPQGELLPRIC